MRTLARLTPQQRIGQLLMVGVPADDVASWRSVLGSAPAGGVFLVGRSTASVQHLAGQIAGLQQIAGRIAGVPLHVSVDQEGGYVQTLRGPGFGYIPTALRQGRQSSATLAANTARWASSLVRAGVTLDLAPVADTVPAGTASTNPPIGRYDRQYGSTPGAVARAVRTVVTAMLGQRLGTTVKHFPGLGRVTANTDTSSHAVDNRTTAADPALQPFERAITAGTTAVMISSARYPRLDRNAVAAFSRPIITGLLRRQLHFAGLVMSDDLGNAVAVRGVPVGSRAVNFIAAGGDLVLTVRGGDFAPMIAALTGRAARDPGFRALVQSAELRVIRSKQALGMLSCR